MTSRFRAYELQIIPLLKVLIKHLVSALPCIAMYRHAWGQLFVCNRARSVILKMCPFWGDDVKNSTRSFGA
jgi:hypothetical protein